MGPRPVNTGVTHFAPLAAPRRNGYPVAPMSRNKFPPKPRPNPDDGPVYLYGLHTVRAALDNPRRGRRRLLATPN
ncbi:MAG TPA: 23S rRNA (guanosine(2251)-2'-O)-methyltransferase RlmB, partial [Alphaproteobacteria bacterium]|nr:23S rRNA (guanosine(2251)-2'-O)-methyltransferase RlmB [Alphaproteobacteria bacterium]